MIKQYTIRYGHNYKVLLAIVLPSLLIIPFILLVQFLPEMEEWKIWLIIFAFLSALISLTLWLVMRIYPTTLLTIDSDKISLSFKNINFLSPADFSFNIADITSMTSGEIGGDEYFIFEVRNPDCKFQVSPASNEIDDFLSFNEAMVEISEKVNSRK